MIYTMLDSLVMPGDDDDAEEDDDKIMIMMMIEKIMTMVIFQFLRRE